MQGRALDGWALVLVDPPHRHINQYLNKPTERMHMHDDGTPTPCPVCKAMITKKLALAVADPNEPETCPNAPKELTQTLAELN